jgi:hypothetical protein
MRLPAAIVIAASLLAAPGVRADIILVLPDGGGDYPTIQSAIDASTNGDVVELGDGVFTGDGNRDLDVGGRAIIVRSRSGDPSTCQIDCEGSPADAHRGFVFEHAEGAATILSGFTVRGAYTGSVSLPEDSGGAILCYQASPTLRNLRILGNHAFYGAGICCATLSEPLIEECRFESNNATYGALHLSSSSPAVRRCSFVGNVASYGGGMSCIGSNPTVTECLFSANSGPNAGGAVFCHYSGMPTLESCRFEFNQADASVGRGGAITATGDATITVIGSIFIANSAWNGGAVSAETFGSVGIFSSTFVENEATHGGAFWVDQGVILPQNTIVAFSTSGGAAACGSSGAISPYCCDFFGNTGGDWTGCVADWYGQSGNVAEDPLFCDRASRDLTLRSDSPCAAGNNAECGQIGALGVGCEPPTAIQATTWGRVKASYHDATR